MPKLSTGQVTRPDLNPDMAPNAWGKLRSELARLGYSQSWINSHIGNNIGGRDKSEIIQALRDALNTEDAAAVRAARIAS